MDEKRKRAMSHKRRIRNLTSLCGLSAIILAVSTYAWFTLTINNSKTNIIRAGKLI